MKKIIGVKTLKIGIGAAAAMLAAYEIGLKYSASAGIITILSIQDTRRESLQVAIRRIVAACIALLIGGMLFSLAGFNAISFGVYLILFIPTAVKMNVTEGIVPASVLVTHLLGEGYVDSGLVINEIMLMLVGAGVAMIVNIYMPSLEESLLIEKRKIEELMYEIFTKMENALIEGSMTLDIDQDMMKLEQSLIQAMDKATKYRNNSFIGKKSLYEKYFDMRLAQYDVMVYMKKHFEKFYMVASQAHEVARLTHEVAVSIHGKVLVETLLEQLERLMIHFKASELPKSREEFENRAMLYQFLTDIEQFLEIKRRFKNQLSDIESKEYSSYYSK